MNKLNQKEVFEMKPIKKILKEAIEKGELTQEEFDDYYRYGAKSQAILKVTDILGGSRV